MLAQSQNTSLHWRRPFRQKNPQRKSFGEWPNYGLTLKQILEIYQNSALLKFSLLKFLYKKKTSEKKAKQKHIIEQLNGLFSSINITVCQCDYANRPWLLLKIQ